MNDMLKNEIKLRLKDIIEKEMSEVVIEPTPMKEENDKINSAIPWQQFFHDLFLEILNIENGFVTAKTSYTEALLEFGSKENPQALYQFIDMLTIRLERLHIVKRMCYALGLQTEMDRIIDNEMSLIYKTPQVSQSKMVDRNNTVAGDTGVK